MSSPSRPVRYTATLISAAYALALYLSGFKIDALTKQALAYLPALAALLVLAFDLWIWKWKGIHRLVGRARIDGCWLGALTPSTASQIPEGGNRGPIPAALLIEQTYWSVSVTLMTAESRSVSTSAAIEALSRQQAVLAYTYANTPKAQHRHRSQPHVGASRFTITGREPSVMTGSYWTDRLTTGGMEMALVNRKADYPDLAAVQSVAKQAP